MSTEYDKLKTAIRDNHVETVQRILSNGYQIDEEDNYWNSLLTAINTGNVKIATLLVDAGARIHSTVFHNAIILGVDDIVKLFLDKGCDANMLDSDGWSPLFNAIYHNDHFEITTLLIEHGADMYYESAKGNIMRALIVKKAKLRKIKFLVDAGFDINHVSNATLLNYAMYDTDLVHYLLDAGANVNILNDDNEDIMYTAIANNAYEVAKMILPNRTIGIDHQNKYGNTLLHAAVAGGRPRIVRLILQAGANVNIQNHTGNTAIYNLRTLTPNDLEIAEMLIDKGLNVNLKNMRNETIIAHMGVRRTNNNFCEFIKMIINAGLDLKAESEIAIRNMFRIGNIEIIKLMIDKIDLNAKELTTLEFGRYICNNDKILKIFMDAGYNIHAKTNTNNTLLFNHMTINSVNRLLNAGLDINHQNKNGNTALHHWIINGSFSGELFDLPNIDVNIVNIKNQLPLHLFISCRRLSGMEKLLAKTKDCNMPDAYNMTPLHYAACGYSPQIVELLQQYVTDVNCKDTHELTPLHYAAFSGCLDVVRSLMRYPNIDLNCRDNLNMTPLNYAAYKGNSSIVELLMDAGADTAIDLKGSHVDITARYAILKLASK